MDIHERIALALKWSVEDVKSFSLPTLRGLVSHVDPKLATEIADATGGCTHWFIPVNHPPKL